MKMDWHNLWMINLWMCGVFAGIHYDGLGGLFVGSFIAIATTELIRSIRMGKEDK